MENLNLRVTNLLNNLIGATATAKLNKAFKDQKNNLDLNKILNSSEPLLSAVIGDTYASRLKSALELFPSMLEYNLSCKDITQLSTPEAVGEFLRSKIGYKEREYFLIIFLNAKNEILGYKELFSGTINQAQVYPREVIKESLAYNAASVIISHNHPSGSSKPSADDILMTSKLEGMLKDLEIRLHDHIIVSNSNQMFSIKANRFLIID